MMKSVRKKRRKDDLKNRIREDRMIERMEQSINNSLDK